MSFGIGRMEEFGAVRHFVKSFHATRSRVELTVRRSVKELNDPHRDYAGASVLERREHTLAAVSRAASIPCFSASNARVGAIAAPAVSIVAASLPDSSLVSQVSS